MNFSNQHYKGQPQLSSSYIKESKRSGSSSLLKHFADSNPENSIECNLNVKAVRYDNEERQSAAIPYEKQYADISPIRKSMNTKDKSANLFHQNLSYSNINNQQTQSQTMNTTENGISSSTICHSEIFYQQPQKTRGQMNDFSVKILNEILNSPHHNHHHLLENDKMQKQELSRNRYGQDSYSRSPLTSSRGFASQNSYCQLSNSYINQESSRQNQQLDDNSSYQNNKQQMYNNNEQKLDSEEVNKLSQIIEEKKDLISKKKYQLNLLEAQNNLCNSSQLQYKKNPPSIDYTYKCNENQKKIEQMLSNQALEKNELHRIEDQIQRIKNKIEGLQTKLEITKNQEYKFFQLKDKKIKEVKEEFHKKNKQMTQLFNDVSMQYSEFVTNLNCAEELYNSDLEIKAMLKEELNGKLIQRAELVAQKEEMEQIYEQFVSQYGEENEYLENYRQIMKQKEQLLEQSQQHSYQQLTINQQIMQCEQTLPQLNSQLHSLSNQLSTLSQIIQNQKYQPSQLLEQSEQALTSLQSQFKLPDLEVFCSQFVTKSQGGYFNQNEGPGIQQIITGIRQNKIGKSINDVIEFMASVALKEYNEKCRQNYIYNLDNLIGSLLQLEDVNDKYYGDEQQIVIEIEEVHRQMETMEKQKSNWSDKAESLKQQISTNHEEAKKFEQKLMVFQENLKISVNKMAQIVFEDYCLKSQDKFKQMAEIQGQESVDRLMEDHRDQFYQMIATQQKERIDKMIEIREEKEKLEKNVCDNINTVESEILPKLKSLVLDLQGTKAHLEQMNCDLQAYQQAKCKVEEDMSLLQNCLEQKIQEISQVKKGFEEQFEDVIGKTDSIEQELNDKFQQINEATVAAERTRQNIRSLLNQEQILKIENASFNECRRISNNKRLQTASEMEKREQEIVELEKEVAYLEKTQIELMNHSQISSSSNQIGSRNLSSHSSQGLINAERQNQKSHSQSYFIPQNINSQNKQQDQPSRSISNKNSSLSITSPSIKLSGHQFTNSNLSNFTSTEPPQMQLKKVASQIFQTGQHSQSSSQTYLSSQANSMIFNQTLRGSGDFSNCEVLKQSDIINRSANIVKNPFSPQRNQKSINKTGRSPKGSFSNIEGVRQSQSNISQSIVTHSVNFSNRASSPSKQQQMLPQQQQLRKVNSNTWQNHQSSERGQIQNEPSHFNNTQNSKIYAHKPSSSKGGQLGSPKEKAIPYPNTSRVAYQTNNYQQMNNIVSVSTSFSGRKHQNSPSQRQIWK